MFKVINLNPNYEISLEKEIRRVDGSKLDLKIKNGKVFLPTDNGVKLFDLEWLALMSFYRVEYNPYVLNNLNLISFKDINPVENKHKLRDIFNNKIMCFDSPIYYNKDYRIVPCYPGLAVNKDGCVIRIRDKRPLGFQRDSRNKYLHINYLGLTIPVHRLVALAWLDFDPDRMYVNHKNGIRNDNRVENLEWVTQRENIIHARDTGLQGQGIKCRVRNFYTKEVTEYPSITTAAEAMGITAVRIGVDYFTDRMPMHLFEGKWEVRLGDDNTPWFYENRDEIVKNGKYCVTVIEDDGTEREFWDLRDLFRFYKIWNINQSHTDLTKALQERHPTWKITVEGHDRIYPIQVLNVSTGEVTEYPSAIDVTRKLGFKITSRTHIQTLCKRNEHRIWRGYCFRYKHNSDKEWEPKGDLHKPRTIIVTNRGSDSEVIESYRFPTLRATARHFNIDRSIIRARLRSGKDYNGWKFHEIYSNACYSWKHE